MSFQTRYYNLEAFKWGEVYSSQVDQRRFTIIDNQLAFLSDLVGSGIICGFNITDNNDGTILVDPGIALINKRVCQSFGGYSITLADNTIHYIYLQSKSQEVGGISGTSNIASVVGYDTSPPSPPSGIEQELSIIDYMASLPSYDDDFLFYIKNMMGRIEEDDNLELIDYKELAFKWSENTEPDFSHYKITRIDGSNEELLGTTEETIYVDVNLEQDHEYTYQIVAIDLSGNESSISSITLKTEEDSRVPLPPGFVQIFPSDQRMEIIWENSPTENVDSYRVVIQMLDDDYNNYGAPTSVDVDAYLSEGATSTYAIFENLENNKKYNVTVSSIGVSGALSEGISVKTYLEYLPGAGEINDINAVNSISSLANVGIETDLFWRYQQVDPSLPHAYKFLIKFIENGKRVSETIEVLETESLLPSCPDGNNDDGACYSLNIKYIPYMVNGNLVYESIKEYTPYIIEIKTSDVDGNISNGFIQRIDRTIVSTSVAAVENFSIERKGDNSIFLQWTNPSENYFSYNLITIRIVDLGSDDIDGIAYVENERIDRAETYIIPSEHFNINYRYDIIISPYNVFGKRGEIYETAKQFSIESTTLRPTPPSNLLIFSGDAQLYLRWIPDLSNEREIAFYKVYRSLFKVFLRSSDFSSIATIPSTKSDFIDYSVINGTSYSYFVTSVDIYGVESLNPSEDNYISSFIVSCTPSESISLSAPEGLSVSANSNNMDAELSWDASAGYFDGYEILKSVGNNYSFSVIDYVPISQLYYVDENALLKTDEVYYYMVRKYKSEVDLKVISSLSDFSESVLIGVVTTSNGVSNVDIDIDSVVHLENFEDPITSKTEDALSYHRHDNEEEMDKRIELRSSVKVSTWSTNDYQVYLTEEDIEGATGYFLNVSGEVNEDYFTSSKGIVDVVNLNKAQSGESPILYEIDQENGKIIFDFPLYSPDQSFKAPYSTEPVITLDLSGISEVDNYLPENKIGNLSATQFDSGQLETPQMSTLNHEGRKEERLFPLKIPLKTLDNFVFSIADTYEDSDRNNMGSSVAFYDIIFIEDERLLAATSNGIWLSENYGNDWSQAAVFDVAVHHVYKSFVGDYYALTNYGVYKNSGDSFKSWIKMDGLDFVKVIRDITEDSDSNIYISSDLGVFKLNSEDVPYIHDCWEKMPIFGAESSEAYAIIFDSNYSGGRILVSNELGLIQSTDSGRSWSYIGDMDPFIKVRKFVLAENYLFALSDNAVYREMSGNSVFERIAEMDSTRSCDMEIFEDNIYVSTDIGAKKSDTNNIFLDTDIEMVSVFSIANVRDQVAMVSSLSNIGDHLFVGVDRKLFVQNRSGKIWCQFEQKNTIIPTFYLDDEIIKVGFYYNNSSYQNVSFDEIVDLDKKVFVCNKYDIYFAENKGWADCKYDASFVVYQNDIEFGRSKDEITIDMNQFVSVVFPEYDDNNAHKELADLYKSQVESNLVQITSIGNSGPISSDLISDTYNKFELFLSQLYEEARVLVDTNGQESQFILPSINTDLVRKSTSVSNLGEVVEIEENVYKEINDNKNTNYTATVNIVNGTFSFGVPFDKYDQLMIDVFGVSFKNIGEYSHREIEDAFEMIYSGPPSYLSQVQQVNLVKLGIFSNKMWPNEQNELSTPVQLNINIPVDDTWYDSLNSTVNYTEETYFPETNLSLSYPSAALYIPETEKVFVGGLNGALSIDIDTIDIEQIQFGSIDGQIVRSIFQYNNKIYIVSDKNIFVSSDYGESWSEYNKSGLPNYLYSMGGIAGNLVVGAKDGLYIKMSDSDAVDWEKVVSSTNPVSVICSSNILFSVVDRKIYVSSNGFNYTNTDLGSDLDITNIVRYGYTNTYVSTNQGLYSDNGTFNSLSPSLQSINLRDLINSENSETINDVGTNDDNLVAIAVSNGTYGLIQDSLLKIKEFTFLDTIHKVLVIGDEVWLFGQDSFKIPGVNYPIKLSTGAPL